MVAIYGMLNLSLFFAAVCALLVALRLYRAITVRWWIVLLIAAVLLSVSFCCLLVAHVASASV